MIEFVDLETGKLFHVEPNDPYTFWFDEGQSINLNYVKPICFISDQSTVHISCDSPVFSLLKQLDETFPRWWENHQTIINAKAYADLSELKIGRNETYTLTGYPWRNNSMQPGEYLYVYIVYVLASSNDSGQIRDKIKINDDEYEVGADFYTPNEILKSNLENFDISIPESIQKAIFDVDVHEESNDNITLNRKYKELLMNYWDMVANKGSYKSLINSLAWFEWGDLVRIEEVWKRHGRNMKDYFHTDLNRTLDPEFISQLKHNAKTTYIGLYTALSKFTYDWNGKMEYRDNVFDMGPLNSTSRSSIYEPTQPDSTALDLIGWDAAEAIPMDFEDPGIEPGNIEFQSSNPQGGDRDVVVYTEHIPNLQLISTKWGLLELCLKMTLLGNFYSTYFMPIHMDLIHSTVEAWVFGYTQKLLNTTGFEQVHTASFGNAFDLQYEDHCQIRHVDTRTYSTTMFKGLGTVFGLNENTIEEERTPWDPDQIDNFNPLKYFYGGTAGSITCNAVIPAEDEYDYLVAQRCTWARSSEDYGELNCGEGLDYDPWFNVWLRPDLNPVTEKWEHRFKFTLGFREPGHYKLGVEFTLSSGNTYNRTFEVDVEDNISNHIDLYKVMPLGLDVRGSMSTIYTDDGPRPWMHCFQMTPGPNDQKLSIPEDPNWAHSRRLPGWSPDKPWEYVGYKQHGMFIQTLGVENGIGLNHTVIFEAIPGDELTFTIDGSEINIPVNDQNSIILNTQLNDSYVWIYNSFIPNDISQTPQWYKFIGISRKFNYEDDYSDGLIQSITDTNEDLLKPVIEERFHPFMYQLEKFENWTPENGPTIIQSGDVIYMDPVLKYSRNPDDDRSDYNWVFLNKSTGVQWGSNRGLVGYHSINNLNKEVYTQERTGGMETTMVLPYNQYDPTTFQLTRLDPGYYNIKLWYKKSEEWLNYEYNSAFLVGRD